MNEGGEKEYVPDSPRPDHIILPITEGKKKKEGAPRHAPTGGNRRAGACVFFYLDPHHRQR